MILEMMRFGRSGRVFEGCWHRRHTAAEEAGAEVELLDFSEPRLPMYEPAAANAALVHVVHSLRGIVVDLAEKIGVDERVGAVA